MGRFPVSRLPFAAVVFTGVLLHVAPRSAATVDTTLVGDGSPGPYRLGNAYIDTTTLTVSFQDSALASLSHAYVEAINGVLFSGPVDSGARIHVGYETRFHGVSKRYSLYEKIVLDPSDTTLRTPDTAEIRPEKRASATGNDLEVSGYKSVGVSIGSLGSTNLSQAMDVAIFGEVAPGTELRAHLSDQGSSLEGTTREIGEIDMIYLTLTNPKYTATVGDQFISWPAGGLLSGEKKIKGISASVTPGRIFAKGFGAVSGGTFTVQTLRGRTGFQGPYVLTGNGSERIVTPIGGTVSIKVNGAGFVEGEERDYTVDYDLGTVTFTPRQLITDEDFIRIEYEYRTYDYQRTLLGTDLGLSLRDSSIVVRGALWNEGDGATRPIDLELTTLDRDSLAQAGDRVYRKPFGRPVHPNDAAAEAVLYPLYTDGIDSSTGRRVFRYINPDTATVSHRYFRVDFVEVGAGNGDYLVDTVMEIQPGRRYEIHRFAGTGGGTHACEAPFPAPRGTTVGEVTVAASPAPWFSSQVNVAGLVDDRNLLSPRDDDDNYGAATAASFTAGRRDFDRRSVWLSGEHRFTSRRFGKEVLSADARRRGWDQAWSAPGDGQEEILWETAAGATPWRRVHTEFGYGQAWHADSLVTDRLSNRSGMTLFDRLSLMYSGTLFRHRHNPAAATARRDSLRTALKLGGATCWIYGADEWRTPVSGSSRGHISMGAGFEGGPLGLSEEFVYTSDRRSGHREVVFAADTGYSLLWKQSLTRDLLPSWRVSGTSSHYRSVAHNPRSEKTATLIRCSQEITAKRGFSTRQEYSINSEQAAAMVQTPKYVGKGLGTHTIDSTGSGDKYLPRVGGEWIIQERELYSEGDNLVRRTGLSGDWAYLPPAGSISGLLGDIEWRGSLLIEEHLALTDQLTSWSWVPGYYSLLEEFGDSLIRFADLFYRQNAEWRPTSFPGLRGIVFGEPFLKMQRAYRETGAKWGGGIDRTGEKLFLGAVTEFLRLRRRPGGAGIIGLSGDAGLESSDGFLELTQKYRVDGDVELFVKETGGRTGPRLVQGDWYYGVTPGITWRPTARGWAQASYTFSRVEGTERGDYRTARGYPPGTSHVIDAFADVTIGENFGLHGSYRGEISSEYEKGIHAVSMEVKAYL